MDIDIRNRNHNSLPGGQGFCSLSESLKVALADVMELNEKIWTDLLVGRGEMQPAYIQKIANIRRLYDGVIASSCLEAIALAKVPIDLDGEIQRVLSEQVNRQYISALDNSRRVRMDNILDGPGAFKGRYPVDHFEPWEGLSGSVLAGVQLDVLEFLTLARTREGIYQMWRVGPKSTCVLCAPSSLETWTFTSKGTIEEYQTGLPSEEQLGVDNALSSFKENY